MATHTIISLFSGAGMLDAAVRCAIASARTVCYVEREAPAAAILAARMADGSLCEAPIWSDITTFDGKPWRGRVDGIIGGFPCTDLSVAGRQAGLDGDASGLFFEYVRIIREVQPRWVFIENVPPVLSFPTGGTVLGELAALGFDAEWGTVRASDVGAPHRRDRAFILAYRGELDNTDCNREVWSGEAEQGTMPRREELAYAPQRGLGELRKPSGRGGLADGCNEAVGNAELPGRPQPVYAGFAADATQAGAGLDYRSERTGGMVDDAECKFCGHTIDPSCGRYGCANCEGEGLADTGGEESPWGQQRESSGEVKRGEAFGSATELCPPLFPPGPADSAAWQRILAERPDLAPAVGGRLNPNFVEGLMNLPAGWTKTKGVIENYAEYQARTGEALRRLLGATCSEAIQRQAGKHECFPSPEILQQGLHGGGDGQACCEKADLPPEGEAVDAGPLRNLPSQGPQVDHSPQEPDLERQQPKQPTNPLLVVSHLIASCQRRDFKVARAAALRLVRTGWLKENLQHVSDEDQPLWQGFSEATWAELLLEACLCLDSASERVDRLRALGNGVVVLQAAYAFAVLAKRAGLNF